MPEAALEILYSAVEECAACDLPLPIPGVLDIATELHLEFTGNDDVASEDWLRKTFRAAYPNVTFGQGKVIPDLRLKAACLPSVISSIDNLREHVRQYKIKSKNILVADETDMTINVFEPKKVGVMFVMAMQMSHLM